MVPLPWDFSSSIQDTGYSELYSFTDELLNKALNKAYLIVGTLNLGCYFCSDKDKHSIICYMSTAGGPVVVPRVGRTAFGKV